jgi:hypothetical protein
MRSRWNRIGVIIVAGVATPLAGCGMSEEPCGDEDCESRSSAIEQPCESFGCGGNAQIMGTSFHELHASPSGGAGLPNDGGVVVESFLSGQGAEPRLTHGTGMVLDVQGDRLVGLVAGQSAVADQELYGATIRLRGNVSHSLSIHAMAEIEFWVSAEGRPGRVRAYTLAHHQPGQASHVTICGPRISLPGPPHNPRSWGDGTADSTRDDVPIGEPDVLNMAIIFAGDRYDRSRGTVDASGEPGWFNIACVGTALAKMHLLRHTSAGSGSTSSPNLEQRQAMLKLLSADYCGDGDAYARHGTPLFYQDQGGLYDPAPWLGDRVAEFEAIWTADGALCLDDPRRWEPTQSYAELRADIIAGCESATDESRRRTIPRCTADQLASWQSFGHISRNVNLP